VTGKDTNTSTFSERDLVIEILSRAFDQNQSVNHVIKQDSRRARRIRALMAYSYDLCRLFGKVFVSEDGKACALVLFPDRRRTTPASVWLDLKLIAGAIGFSRLFPTLRREALLTRIRPREPMYYLWFIGVLPACQHQGLGGRLLDSVLGESRGAGRPVYLETSTVGNLPWYGKFGFETYHELDTGYRLYFLKRPVR
jgi:ribosomal protein S18 acetylase RimI-like enzyme